MTRFGWTVGAGLEYMLAPNWSAKIEYDYQDFGTRSVFFCDPTGCAIADYKQNAHLVLVGLNFRFNPFVR